MSNFTQANRQGIKFSLNMEDYFDMTINQDNTNAYSITGYPETNDDCLSCVIDTEIPDCISGSELISTSAYIWADACSVGLELNNIGFTGVDNGLIQYSKDRVTDQEFYDIYTKSKYTLPEDDLRLHLHAVSGTTKQYEYPTSINEDGSIKLTGGFYQGFFKSKDNYSILPSTIDSTWNLEFLLKPEGYEEPNGKTLNYANQNNKGIFFYIGTRAENKWVELYNQELVVSGTCECDESTTSGDTEDSGDDFIEDDIDLSKVTWQTNNGFKIESANDVYTVSDNKFIMFDRTRSGVTVSNYYGDEEVQMTYKTHYSPKNLFLYLNHTPSGYTVSNINEVTDSDIATYNDFYKDIYENALAFKINDDGSIGYRYLVKDCSGVSEAFYNIQEGYSLPGIIETSEWAKINVKIKASEDYMKIYFYVNGKLKYITKELPKLNLHDLAELDEKEEGVAYNISLGGGTQGLAEMVLPNYMELQKNCYPLQANFAGTFIGDIKYFKFYTC